jgi:gluconolactonase
MASNAAAQTSAPAGGLEALIAPGAEVETVAEGFTFIEGPVWVPASEGSYLLFSDIPANRVQRYLPSGDETTRISVFLDPVTPDDSPAGGVGGSNGLALDLEGRLILCEHGNRRVARMEADGSRTTLAERFEGKRLNSPNDIVFRSSGDAYFTDPSYGLTGQTEGKELEWNGIYRLRHASGKSASDTPAVELMSKEVELPNGIGLSPDEKTLYVANSSQRDRLWYAFPVSEDGRLGPGRVHFDGSQLSGPGVPDGFAVDERGNLWASGPGGIVVISPEGKHLGTVSVPEVPANAGFGGDDGKTLFITARTGLYSLRTNVRGLNVRTSP